MFKVSRLQVISARALLFLLLFFALAPAARGQLEFDVIMHDITVQPVKGQLANHVEAYISILDKQGKPIKSLKTDGFRLIEDSEQVAATVEEAPETPVSLVLVMDTSGSMAGQGITKAREASVKFVNRMSKDDSVAVISFNDKVNLDFDFTNNPSIAASTLSTLNVTPGAGTCLYDAIYKALEISSVVPGGRRAVLVLTDGRDELPNGKPCSSTVIDDVINLANSNINTPIYSIGVGKEIDENGLKRMALLSGGSFLKGSDFSQMDQMFETMFDQLKYQYRVSYDSKATPGKHSLTIQVELGSIKEQDTREFILPDLLPVLTITSPQTGDPLEEKTLVKTEITGQAEAVANVTFEINGQVAAKDEEAPFTYEIDPAGYQPGILRITAKAADESGTVLSEGSLEVKIVEPKPTATTSGEIALPKPTETVAPIEEPEQPEETNSSNLLYWIAGGGGFLLIVALGIVMVVKPFGKRRAGMEPPANRGYTNDATFDSGAMSILGELAVIFSDDSSRNNERIKITQSVTTIGRSASCDIAFPNDHPVSRRHAQLELKGGQFWLSEMLSESNGGMKPPTFGTFLNDEKMAGSPVKIKSGDEIRLGNRLKLRFTALAEKKADVSYESETIDELNDATID